jgi:restriction system protein
VAVNEDPFMGGHCIIQAKALSKRGGRRAVRDLAGVMDDKHATTGILVTTSWVTKDGHDFAQRNGRIRLIECEEIIPVQGIPGSRRADQPAQAPA